MARHGVSFMTCCQSGSLQQGNLPAYTGKKTPCSLSKGKIMHEVFFDIPGLIPFEFIPESQTVSKEMYVAILQHLRDAV